MTLQLAMRLLIGFQLGLALVLGGCGSKYGVSVSALAAPGADSPRRYVLIPGNSGVTVDDLQFREFADYLNRAMLLQGYTQAQTPRDAECVVVVGYGIGEPQQQIRTIPYRGVPIIQSYDSYTRWLWLVAFSSSSVGIQDDPRSLWRVTAVSSGRSSDLRDVFPYLVAASRPYLGKATVGGAIQMEFAECDRRVAELREVSPQEHVVKEH